MGAFCSMTYGGTNLPAKAITSRAFLRATHSVAHPGSPLKYQPERRVGACGHMH